MSQMCTADINGESTLFLQQESCVALCDFYSGHRKKITALSPLMVEKRVVVLLKLEQDITATLQLFIFPCHIFARV